MADQTPHGFDWIEDLDLLRDEGVYFGMVEAPAEVGLKDLEEYFEQKKQPYISEQEIAAERKTALREDQVKLEEMIEAGEGTERGIRLDLDLVSHSFYEYLFRFLAYGAVLVLNYWLIFDLLAPRINYPFWITTGVYLFGNLALFFNTSLLFSPNNSLDSQRERPKSYLEEYAIPLVATLFILFWRNPAPEPQLAISGIFIFALFLFGGRGFLIALSRMRQEFIPFSRNLRLRKHRKLKLNQIQGELRDWRAKHTQVIREQQELENRIDEQRRQIDRVDREGRTRKQVFLREYHLARHAREKSVSGDDADYVLYG